MPVELERERTYLPRRLPDGMTQENSVVIHDIYVPETADHANLRLRRYGDVYEMTKKVPLVDGDSSRMNEHTIPLTRIEFEALARSSQKSLHKRRYYVTIDGYDAEVDVYEDALAGLVVIDFEFTNDVSFQEFAQPDIALADVTQDEVVGGGFLAGKTYDDIRERLEAYGYEKLETVI